MEWLLLLGSHEKSGMTSPLSSSVAFVGMPDFLGPQEGQGVGDQLAELGGIFGGVCLQSHSSAALHTCIHAQIKGFRLTGPVGLT